MQRLNLTAAILAGAIALGGGYVAAQEEEPAAPVPAPSTRAATLDGQLEQEARNLTAEEKLEVSQQRIVKMKEALTATNELLDQARQSDSDIVRVNCINEKLAAIKGFLKVSEQSYTSLRDAASEEDPEAQLHHFSLITIAGQKVNDLQEEAQTCVGDVELFADETVVDRKEDPGIANVDPIQIDDDDFDDGFATETLPELTPFQ